MIGGQLGRVLRRSSGQAWYRARQFGNVFRARVSQDEQALLRQVLNPEQQGLFLDMHPVAQRHHMDVCLDLQSQGWRDPEVLAAALLHDVGKGQLGVWERTAIVLAETLMPRLFSSPWAQGRKSGRFRWLGAQAGHAGRGAALVAAAGGASRTVTLIRGHDSGGDDPASEALRRADDRN